MTPKRARVRCRLALSHTASRVIFTSRRFSLTVGEALIGLALLLGAVWATATSRAYLGEAYCTSRKGPLKCSSLSYRIGKAAEHLGDAMHVIVALMLLPLTKHSIFYRLFPGTSFERAIAWHRFLARWCLGGGMLLHGGVYIIKWATEGVLLRKLFLDGENLAGFIAALAAAVTFVLALERVRRGHYNLFRVAHMLAAPVFLGALLLHHHGDKLVPLLALPVVLLVLDLVIRYRGVAARRSAKILSVRQVGPEITHLVVGMSDKFVFAPGQWAFIGLPVLSRFEYKPLTLLRRSGRVDDGALLSSSFEVYVKRSSVAGRWSRRLHDLSSRDLEDAGSTGKKTEEADDEMEVVSVSVSVELTPSAEPKRRRGRVNRRTRSYDRLVVGDEETPVGRRVMIDGPYGTLALPLPLGEYRHVLLIAGGIGITPALGWLSRCSAGVACAHTVWAVRDIFLFQELAPRIRAASATASLHLTGGTMCPEENKKHDKERQLGEGSSLPPTTTTNTRRDRPDLAACVNEAVARVAPSTIGTGGVHLAVLVCGPSSMTDDVRKACRRHQRHVSPLRLHFHAETFGW